MQKLKLLIGTFVIHFSLQTIAQDSIRLDNLVKYPSRYLEGISQKTNDFSRRINEKTAKYLLKIKKQEERLYNKLYKKDSIAAKQIFGNLQERYHNLQAMADAQVRSMTAYTKVYSPKLDSLITVFRFLDNSNLLAPELRDKLISSLQGLNDFQDKLNQTDQIKNFLKERKKYLTTQLENFGLARELKQFNRKIYYYQQQIKEYRELWENPEKLEKKLIQLVANVPAFKDFFYQNSQLASLFRLPGSPSANLSNVMTGLQTRTTVQQNLIDRLGSGNEVQRLIQENLQNVQGQVNQLKSQLNQRLPQGGGSDEELPDFKPNHQKTKSFFQRLELGTNFQTQRASNIFPTTTDLGFSLGYRLTDKNIVGIGASYKVGWGKSWNDLRISHQGISLRSFIDLRLKGNLFISGGYEQNFKSEIQNIDQLRNQSAWQQSGLVGLSKSVSTKSKILKKSKVQLFWDFLSYNQRPITPPLIFRISYSIK